MDFKKVEIKRQKVEEKKYKTKLDMHADWSLNYAEAMAVFPNQRDYAFG